MKTYTKTNPKAILLIVLLVPVVAISLASCSLCGVDGDEEGVFIKKPYIFGKGGGIPKLLTEGLSGRCSRRIS